MRDSTALSTQQLAQVFNEHRGELRHFLQGRLKCRHTADDLTQETYLRLIRTRAESVSDWRALIFRIARNLLIDHVRGNSRRGVVQHELQAVYDLTGDRPEMDEQLVSEEQHALLESGLSQLPDQTRRVFELCRNEGLSHREIAEQLGISLRTVARQIEQAIRFLRSRMEP
ncbi:RNA polymerase sigma factor [Steroidobacter flavus]|uniref:RNA polymerase sigma factor n=1 Tax=Steroidobacter flavus TaxID=1842136 RepID=A0ABV8SLU6_9GAMM